MKFKSLRLLLLPMVSVLSACNTSATPFIDSCKLMVASITGNQNISWENSKKNTTDSDMLKIELFFSGQSPNQTAVCLYPTENIDNDEKMNEGQYRGSPTVVTINGQRVGDEGIVKATLEATKRLGKQNYNQLSDGVINLSDKLTSKARKAALDATNKIQKQLEETN